MVYIALFTKLLVQRHGEQYTYTSLYNACSFVQGPRAFGDEIVDQLNAFSAAYQVQQMISEMPSVAASMDVTRHDDVGTGPTKPPSVDAVFEEYTQGGIFIGMRVIEMQAMIV